MSVVITITEHTHTYLEASLTFSTELRDVLKLQDGSRLQALDDSEVYREPLPLEASLVSGIINWNGEQVTVLDTGELAALSAGDLLTKTCLFATPGQKDITITLLDSYGDTNSASVMEEVVDNYPPEATLELQSITGREATVIPTATDPDGTVADISVHWGDGTITPGCASGAPVTHRYAPAGGTFAAFAAATDDRGATGTSAVEQLEIPANQPAVCELAIVVLGDHLTIQVDVGDSTDPDGSIVMVEFEPEGPLPENGPPSEYRWNSVDIGAPWTYTYQAHGSYTLWVRLTDSDGQTTIVSQPVDVLNVSPAALITLDTLDNRTVSLTPTFMDADGAVVAASLDWGDGSAVIPVASGEQYSHVYPPQERSYLVALTLTDDDGAVGKETLAVQIELPWLSQAGRRMMDYLPPYYYPSQIMRSRLDAEGQELDDAFAAVADVLNQCFVRTATWGLPLWEDEFAVPNIPAPGETEEQALTRRRTNLLAKISGQLTPTMPRIRALVAQFVGNDDFEIVQDHAHYHVTIRLTNPGGVPPYYREMATYLRKLIPAHLGLTIEVNAFIWNELDDQQWDWNELDGLALDWDALEVYA
jgi:hypothetical protein